MKNCTFVKRYFPILINTVPFLASIFVFMLGLGATILFPIIQIIVNTYNYKKTSNIVKYILLNLLMLISSVLSIVTDVFLYYKFISSDSITLLLGNYEIGVALVFVSIITVISAIIKLFRKYTSKVK